MKEQMIASGELQKMSDMLSVSNPQSIVEFGASAANEMSACADEILRRQDISVVNKTGNMMTSLAKIMDKVDIAEIESLDKAPGFFERILSNTQRRLENLMSKYNNVGTEIEKVCVELRVYESEIEKSNEDLAILYENGIESHKMLCKYILAGEHAMEEVDAYIKNLELRASEPEVAMELSNVKQAKQLLEQRLQDLRLAETVALQSLPTIKAMQFGNLNLSRKINSSFIVTIPVFKNAVAQALIAKQQYVQAKAMQALDEKTNEMLLKNAQNAANNMRLTAELAGSSAIKIDTIKQSWQTIMDGIADTKKIQDELAKQREKDRLEIEGINNKFITGTR
jgi:uncharacterized protein YaaN involved in tellurite resistance